MVPAAFVKLTSLPLTANGKVDRRSLPEPATGAVAAGAGPRTPLEESIARVWRSALDVDAVDCDGNFFDLGGSSLQLIEAHARLEGRLGRSVPITVLFEHPTVRSLARALEGASAEDAALRALRERVRRRSAPETTEAAS
jgi:surfactin family lipopeptide synthetase B/lichenysin synthetase B